MNAKTETLLSTLRLQPVVPVIIIEDIKSAVPLARALVAGGLKALEITLRTAAGLDAIKAIAEEVEGGVVGAGTVLDARQWDLAVKAGSKFIVSPGAGTSVLDAADRSDIPLLPGTATATEVMRVRDRGYTVMKFFPAEQAGGAPYVNALASPLAGIQFCPTGGISLKNAMDYLSLSNVVCVGGSWVAPKAMVAAGDWAGITKLAAEAAALRGECLKFFPMMIYISGYIFREELMTSNAQKAANSRYRAKLAESGLVRMEVIVPKKDREIVKALADSLSAGVAQGGGQSAPINWRGDLESAQKRSFAFG